MAGFSFQAMENLLAGLLRDVAALKRFAAAGIPIDEEMFVAPAGNTPVLFDGPTGGLSVDLFRHNRFATLSGGGLITSLNAASGAWQVNLPFAVETFRGAGAYVRVGTWDGSHMATSTNYEGGVFVLSGTRALGLFYKPTISSFYQAVTMTAPFTWAVGDEIRFECSVRVAQGT